MDRREAIKAGILSIGGLALPTAALASTVQSEMEKLQFIQGGKIDPLLLPGVPCDSKGIELPAPSHFELANSFARRITADISAFPSLQRGMASAFAKYSGIPVLPKWVSYNLHNEEFRSRVMPGRFGAVYGTHRLEAETVGDARRISYYAILKNNLLCSTDGLLAALPWVSHTKGLYLGAKESDDYEFENRAAHYITFRPETPEARDELFGLLGITEADLIRG